MAESGRRSPRVHVLPVRVAAAFGLAPVLHLLGMIFTGLGLVMLIPALVDAGRPQSGCLWLRSAPRR